MNSFYIQNEENLYSYVADWKLSRVVGSEFVDPASPALNILRMRYGYP
jgi:hypothetical protein